MCDNDLNENKYKNLLAGSIPGDKLGRLETISRVTTPLCPLLASELASRNMSKRDAHGEGSSRLRVASPDPKKKTDLKNNLGKLFGDIEKKAEMILNLKIPQKVSLFTKLHMESSKSKPDAVVVSKHGAEINKSIKDFTDTMKVEISDLLDFLMTLRMWVQLKVPEMSDGNNFGVGVQEEIIQLLLAGRTPILSVLESSVSYFVKRGKLLTKVIKYPNVQDYRKGVEELDEAHWHCLLNASLDLRNYCVTLKDTMTKNIKKIKQPRSKNLGQSLY
eukprot:jgi/Bigna1/90384/estExt_fgenesh1_pg.C_690022